MLINIIISTQDISRHMKTLQIAVAILATAVGSSPAYGCPFAKTTNEQNLPDDEIHHRSRSLRRRLSDTPEAKGKLKSIIDNRTKEQQKYRSSQQNERSIGGGGSVSILFVKIFSRHLCLSIHSSSTPTPIIHINIYTAFTNYRKRRSNPTIFTYIRS